MNVSENWSLVPCITHTRNFYKKGAYSVTEGWILGNSHIVVERGGEIYSERKGV